MNTASFNLQTQCLYVDIQEQERPCLSRLTAFLIFLIFMDLVLQLILHVHHLFQQCIWHAKVLEMVSVQWRWQVELISFCHQHTRSPLPRRVFLLRMEDAKHSTPPQMAMFVVKVAV